MAQKIYPASPVIAAAFCCAIGVTATSGATAARKSYDVPAGDAAATLTQFARHSGCQIVYLVENVRGEKTQPVRGEYVALDALRVMLVGTALFAVQDESTGALVVSRKRPAPAQKENEESERSRGPPTAAPAPPPETPKTAQPKLTEFSPVKNRTLLAIIAGWFAATGSAGAAPSAASLTNDAPILLSPFEVTSDKDKGFAASNAGTATRLALDMADVPAPYSIMTRDFIEALGITNVGEAASWMPNASFNPPNDMAPSPLNFNSRGLDNGSGQTRNNYLTASLLDSYSLERYEFGRGPNAALFNIGGANSLTGGLGAQTKRAQYDRRFQTIALTRGSWDYNRGTLDLNQPLTNRLAARGNFVFFNRGGWRQNEAEMTKGITVNGGYLLTPKTEVRLEAAYDKTRRNIALYSIWEDVTGWDGVTTFRGPVTNLIYGSNTATPGAPNWDGRALTFQGATQGVNRLGATRFIWAPGLDKIMNWQNMAITRRSDDTVNTPMLSNGVLYTRGTGLAFGNGGGGNQYPVSSLNPNDNAVIWYQKNLPADRYNRAIAGSAFRVPSKSFSQLFNSSDSQYSQTAKDANFAVTHQMGKSLFFEIGGDVNKVFQLYKRGGTSAVRNVYIDINQLLPDGTANPNFLQTYGDAPLQFFNRNVLNKSLRGNAAYRIDADKWGNYIFNLNVGSSARTIQNRNYNYSMADLSDPRTWQSSNEVVYIRQYWNASDRPYNPGPIPNRANLNTFAADNNSYTTATGAVTPHWVLQDWNDLEDRFDNAVLAMSAKYFGGKLAVLAAQRQDRFRSELRSRAEYGDLPADWDGYALYYKPAAPAEYTKLSYIPRNATTGAPLSANPVAASTRPRINQPGVVNNNGVQIYNPFFTNDRFRNDYSPPVNKRTGTTGTYGFVYRMRDWVSLVGNYATSYVPPPTNAFNLDNTLPEPLQGTGYDGGLRFRFLRDRLTINTSYFFNQEDNQRTASPVTASINSLLSASASNNPNSGGGNTRGIPIVLGTDYQSTKTSGLELEIVGAITPGWRVMCNVGTAKVFSFDRYPQTKVLVPENADTYAQVLRDAGGRLDTTQRPNSAPGLAVVDATVTAANAAEQTNAVVAYNNLWANYAQAVNAASVVGNNRISVNIFSDYTIQSGRLKGLRVGLGAQFKGRDYIGGRSGDTVVDPSNTTRVIDDPAVNEGNPLYAHWPVNVTGTFGYTMRLKRWTGFEGKELTWQLVVKNLLNTRAVMDDVFNVALRAPNGDLSQPYRVSTPGSIGYFFPPISWMLTATLKL